MGINHHWNNILFGCTFLVNDTIELFIWLFETFFTAMGGKRSISIFTDQDQAMANAIKEVFPKSRHRLCLWRISQNAKKILVGLYSNHDFHESFDKCLYGNMNVMEFETTWSTMIEKHKQQNNDWLNRLYHV